MRMAGVIQSEERRNGMSTQRPTQAELVEAIRVQYKVSLEEARRLFRESKRVEGKSKFKALAEPEQDRVRRKLNSRRPSAVRVTRSIASPPSGTSTRSPIGTRWRSRAASHSDSPPPAESAPASRNPPRPTPDVTTHSQAIGVEGLSRRAPSLTPCGGSVARIGRSHAYNSGPNSCT